MLAGLGLSTDTDKSMDEESISHSAGKHAGSGSPELSDASNRDTKSQAIENRSSEDESDDAFSMAGEVPHQGQNNSAPEGAVSPNPHNEVVNPTFNSNGKSIIKEEAKSQSLNLSRSMSGRSELNQPFNTIPTMNQTFPAGTGTEKI